MVRGHLRPRHTRAPSSESRVASCLLCGRERGRGPLCDVHDRAIQNPGLTPEQLRGFAGITSASLVGPSGIVVGITDGVTLGRGDGADVVLLHASVSLAHARVNRVDGEWSITDLCSRGGTSVDGVRACPSAGLRRGALLRLAGVCFYFWPERIVGAPRQRHLTPVSTSLTFRVLCKEGAFDLRPQHEGRDISVEGRTQRLTSRERRLLCLLAERRAYATDADLAFIPAAELAAELAYSHVWSDENVRELVHCVRSKLAALGLTDAIESARGAGYRLVGTVTQGVGVP